MKINEVIGALKQYVRSQQEYPDSLESMVLFGSFARGDAKVGSDLDIALVTKDGFSRDDKIAVQSLLDDFNDKLEVSLFCTKREKVETTQDKLNANYWIRKEGVVIWNR